MLDPDLLKILVCPLTKCELTYKLEFKELWSKEAGLAYEVRDGIPVMIAAEARELTAEELESLA